MLSAARDRATFAIQRRRDASLGGGARRRYVGVVVTPQSDQARRMRIEDRPAGQCVLDVSRLLSRQRQTRRRGLAIQTRL